MANGVFLHRSDSRYDDVPAAQYQLPAMYKSRVDQCVGDWIIYLEPSKVRNTRGYFGAAKVQAVIPDPEQEKMFIALMEPSTYLDFASPVPFKGVDGIVEKSVLNAAGGMSGRAQSAVRVIPSEDFVRIAGLGLADEPILPRSNQDRSGFLHHKCRLTSTCRLIGASYSN